MKLTSNKLGVYLLMFAVHVAITVYVIFQSLLVESSSYASGLFQGIVLSGSWIITLKWFHEKVFRELKALNAKLEIQNQQ